MDEPEITRVEIVEDSRLDAREALSDQLAGLWWTFFLRGLLAAAVGIAALFWPKGSISLLLQLVGLLLVLDGVLTLFSFGRRGPAGGVGIVGIIVGLILLLWPDGTARFVFIVLGTFALITGAVSLLAWRKLPEWDPERSTPRNGAILALIIGLLLIFWPGTGMVALGWAIAFAALVVAAVMFWLASRLKNANEHLKTKVINPR